jgi:hypothetical protein
MSAADLRFQGKIQLAHAPPLSPVLELVAEQFVVSGHSSFSSRKLLGAITSQVMDCRP